MDKIERAERLEALAAILDKVPEKNFNIGAWARVNMEHVPVGDHFEQHVCGSSACALGYAALDPELSRRCGIALVADDYKPIRTLADIEKIQEKSGAIDGFDVIAVGEGDPSRLPSGCAAGAKAFGIDYDAAYFLFMPDQYLDHDSVEAKTVASRLRWMAGLSRSSDYNGDKFDVPKDLTITSLPRDAR